MSVENNQTELNFFQTRALLRHCYGVHTHKLALFQHLAGPLGLLYARREGAELTTTFLGIGIYTH